MTQIQDTNNREFHLDDESLAYLLEESGSESEKVRIRAHLRECPFCFRRLANLQRSATERDKRTLAPTPADFVDRAKQIIPAPTASTSEQKLGSQQTGHSSSGFFATIQSWLLPLPKWGYGLAGAAVIACLIAILQPDSPVENKSLGDTLVIARLGPLGFAAGQESIPYEGMSVKLNQDGDSLIFTWPPIEDAQYYDLELLRNDTRKRVTPIDGIETTSYSILRQKLETGEEYEWELSGRLVDGSLFTARAGFRIRK